MSTPKPLSFNRSTPSAHPRREWWKYQPRSFRLSAEDIDAVWDHAETDEETAKAIALRRAQDIADEIDAATDGQVGFDHRLPEPDPQRWEHNLLSRWSDPGDDGDDEDDDDSGDDLDED